MSGNVGVWESKGNKHINVDLGDRPMPYHEVIGRLALKYTKEGDRVLDLGCGLGHISRLIQAGGSRQISVADAYEVCLEKTTASVPVERAYLLSEEGFDIKAAITDRFETVVMSHVLEHLLNPVQAVRDTLELVEPGGHLILAVPNPGRPGVVLSNLFKVNYVNRGHVACWDPSHWRNFLENILELNVAEYAHDFIRIKGVNRVPALMSIGKLLGSVAPWWCFSNIAVVRRES